MANVPPSLHLSCGGALLVAVISKLSPHYHCPSIEPDEIQSSNSNAGGNSILVIAQLAIAIAKGQPRASSIFNIASID